MVGFSMGCRLGGRGCGAGGGLRALAVGIDLGHGEAVPVDVPVEVDILEPRVCRVGVDRVEEILGEPVHHRASN